jgi:hypothetical protein
MCWNLAEMMERVERSDDNDGIWRAEKPAGKNAAGKTVVSAPPAAARKHQHHTF